MRKNTEGKKRKKQGSKKQRKMERYSAGGYLGSIQQRYCMGGGRRSTNIGRGWKKIGSDGKRNPFTKVSHNLFL